MFVKIENILIFYSLISISVSVYIATEECPKNEEYLLCGPACPTNCTNLTDPEICITECAEGCFCVPGFVRSENGTCVTPDQCGKTGTLPICINENEEFTTCGPACPPSCDVPEPEACDLTCRTGCFCKPNYVRDSNGKCVSVDDCPEEQCFNENEVYDQCSAACEPTCKDPEPICTKICMSGCICEPGLLRDDNGFCVTVDKCPKNSTDPSLLAKYLNAIEKLLRLP